MDEFFTAAYLNGSDESRQFISLKGLRSVSIPYLFTSLNRITTNDVSSLRIGFSKRSKLFSTIPIALVFSIPLTYRPP